jgi:hypothetical protein
MGFWQPQETLATLIYDSLIAANGFILYATRPHI